MSICPNPLHHCVRFVSEWRFYEECLSPLLHILSQTSLRRRGGPSWCQTSESVESVLRDVWQGGVIFHWKRKLSGSLALNHRSFLDYWTLSNEQAASAKCERFHKTEHITPIFTPCIYWSSRNPKQYYPHTHAHTHTCTHTHTYTHTHTHTRIICLEQLFAFLIPPAVPGVCTAVGPVCSMQSPFSYSAITVELYWHNLVCTVQIDKCVIDWYCGCYWSIDAIV